MKKRVLFVEDEPRVLKGFERMLRVMRHEWDMAFAESRERALELLDTESFDVVVSDIRVSSINGMELLGEIKRLYPQIVRIVLSGESNPDILMKSTLVSHQFLSKPCDAGTLKATVSRACALNDLLGNASLKRVLARMDSIPSMPALYAEIVAVLNSPNASLRQVGEIISKDGGMSAKMLQLVNSAYFGLSRRISNPVQAVSLLGLNTVKALVLSIKIFSQFDLKKISGEFLDRLWQHNTATGVYAKAITKMEKPDEADNAFMAGILHDTGKLLLAANFPEQYGLALALATDENLPLVDGEREMLGITHAEAGAYLMGLWGLPVPIVEAIAFHHTPAESMQAEFGPLTAVHAANVIEHGENPENWQGASSEADSNYLASVIREDRFEAWREACKNAVRKGEIDE